MQEALGESNANSTGGFFTRGGQEALIRRVGRITSARDIEQTVVTVRDGVPVTVGQAAEVTIGAAIKRGEGSSNAQPAVVLGIQKQPGADTLALTERIDRELAAIQATMPAGMTIERDKVRQADFIETAVGTSRTRCATARSWSRSSCFCSCSTSVPR